MQIYELLNVYLGFFKQLFIEVESFYFLLQNWKSIEEVEVTSILLLLQNI